MSLTWSIVIGITAGFLAGVLIKGRGLGCLANLIVGALGSVLGSWIFDKMDVFVDKSDKVWYLIISTTGAVVLLAFFSLFSRKK